MRHRLAHEIAESSRTTTAHTVRASHGDTLVDIARTVERLTAKRRKLRRELRTVDANIRHAKKELRAMLAVVRGGSDL